MDLKTASSLFKIPRRTLYNKVHHRYLGKPGGATILTELEERHMVNVLLAAAEYGRPLTILNLRRVVKRSLDRTGRTVPKLTDNLPVNDWCLNFIDRHKNILSKKAVKILSLFVRKKRKTK